MAPALEDRGASDLTPSQARALLLVDRTGTRLTELSRRSGVTKQAMMQMVDDLQAMGCVRRTPDPDDGRAKVVRLTARGLRQRARARKALQIVEGRARRRLGSRKYATLRLILEELAAGEE
jgi:DNA-binding MarR family transcriptional regulator